MSTNHAICPSCCWSCLVTLSSILWSLNCNNHVTDLVYYNYSLFKSTALPNILSNDNQLLL
jgi:hypothetical protein